MMMMMVVTMTIKWWWRSKKLGPVAACGLICEQSFCTTSLKKRFCTTGLKLWNFIRFVKKTIKHFSAALTCLTFSAHWRKTFEQMKRVVCVTNKKVSQLSMKSDDDDDDEWWWWQGEALTPDQEPVYQTGQSLDVQGSSDAGRDPRHFFSST